MKHLLIIGLGTVVLGQAAAGEPKRDAATHPIIAQLISEPKTFVNKRVTIYGLVTERKSRSAFFLQDVSQRPLKVVANLKTKPAVGDQITIQGTLRAGRTEPYFLARSIKPTRVVGGGGCC